jgi:hypothetical protein
MEVKSLFFVMITTLFVFFLSCDKLISKTQENWINGCVNCSVNTLFDPMTITDPPLLYKPAEYQDRDPANDPEIIDDELNESFEDGNGNSVRCTIPDTIVNMKIAICHFDENYNGLKTIVDIKDVCPLIQDNDDCILISPDKNLKQTALYGKCTIDDCTINNINKLY